jgi:SAM-dependent methyltransferase
LALSYTKEFFEAQKAWSRQAAEVVLPFLLELVPLQSAVDVGCGTGSWLAVLRNLGVLDILGVDSDLVPSEALEIPPDRFLTADLANPLELDRFFDIAISLEVGEHLPEASAETLVQSLTKLAPVILFSAAIPYQGGTGHMNEQWQDYWARMFRRRGCLAVDALRPSIWDHSDVKYWYAQNMLLYVREERLGDYPALAARRSLPIRIVHPGLYLQTVRRFPPPGEVSAKRFVRFLGRLGRELRVSRVRRR